MMRMNRGSEGVIRKSHGTRPGQLFPHPRFPGLFLQTGSLKTSEALRATI
jgi:hypothetical protein